MSHKCTYRIEKDINATTFCYVQLVRSKIHIYIVCTINGSSRIEKEKETFRNDGHLGRVVTDISVHTEKRIRAHQSDRSEDRGGRNRLGIIRSR